MGKRQPNYYSVESKIETVEEHKEDVAEHIRELSLGQVDTWRRVPYHSWRAYGRLEEEPSHLIACKFGIWPLNVQRRPGYINAGVDLATGTLIDPEDLAVLDTMTVLNLNIYDLNADMVVNGLKRVYGTHRDVTLCSREELALRHKKMRREFNIEPIYFRDDRNPLMAIGRTAVDDTHDEISDLTQNLGETA